MTEQIISPGVFLNENDQSAYTQGPQVIGAALIGPTVQGHPFVPTVVTSFSQYSSIFGTIFQSGSYYYEYFTSLAALAYFQNGGQSLLVTRVISGSNNVASYASSSISPITGSGPNPFQLETLSWGDVMNNSGSEVSGALVNGTINNIRWELTSTNTGSGNFNLNIRAGNDNNATKNILETWSNICLDPQQPNYISAVIGDIKPFYQVDGDGTAYIVESGSYQNNSQYVRVKNVNSLVNSIDNNGNFLTSYIPFLPLQGLSGSFAGGVPATNRVGLFNENITDANNQGFAPTDFEIAIDLLTNQDDYQFNLLLAPGITLTSTAVSDLIATAGARGDDLAVVDAALYGTAVSIAAENAAGQNSSYGATYYPWVQVFSSGLAKAVWVPPTVVMGGVFAYNDSVGAQFYAPAGLNRGGIPSVLKAERKLSQNDRDTLYAANVNPIATFPGEGIVAWGQKTLQRQSTALDRINVRRLLIQLKGYLGGLAKTLTFEQNTNATRLKFLSQANPYMDTLVSQQGLYAYQITMDSTNNTSDVIDRNQLVGTIKIQPTKTAEFIILNFNLQPTGTSFTN
jgi:hypothetical protein